jgi:2-polyprenyl-3-methyl-5-hydroxy-6-metoxy-1,4-benzoquinol methylase
VSSLRADDSSYSIADERTVRVLSQAEDGHFWHLSRNRLIGARLRALGTLPPARVLELGCGGGAVSAYLARSGYAVTGVDGHLPRVVEAAARAPSASFFVHDLSQGTGALGLSCAFDAVGLFDVIEHLDAPIEALKSALDCVGPGGVVVGTVPALMALWSRVDEHAGHRLRYERSGLERLLGSIEGTDLVEVIDFNRHLVPLMWMQRRFVASADVGATAEANFRVPSWPVNGAMLVASSAERRFERLLSALRLPGASLWFALRRRSQESSSRRPESLRTA